MNDVLTIDQAANLLKISKESLRRMAVAGEIPASKKARRWRFIRDDLLNWLREDYRKVEPCQLEKINTVSTVQIFEPETESELENLLKRKTKN